MSCVPTVDVVPIILSGTVADCFENSQSTTEACALKYQRWYDDLMDRAMERKIPACYTEVHHIILTG